MLPSAVVPLQHHLAGRIARIEIRVSKQPVARCDVQGLPLFSPDSSCLALTGDFGILRLTEPATGREIAQLVSSDKSRLIPGAFSPDGSRLCAIGTETGLIYVWDLRLIRSRLRELDLDWSLSADHSP